MSGSSSSENKARNSNNLKYFVGSDEVWSINKISNEVVTRLDAHLEMFNRLYTDDEELDDLRESFNRVKRDYIVVTNAIEQLNNFELRVHKQIEAFLSQQEDAAVPLMIPTIPSDGRIQQNSMFKYFEEKYMELPDDQKMKKCLSCISVFPGGFAIRRTTLRYWWMAEGLIDSKEAAEETIAKLIEMEFIELVMEERTTLENKFIRMDPFIRVIVITLAKRDNFDFDSEGNSAEVTGKALLLSTNQKSSQYAIRNQDPKILETLFNVNQCNIDLQSFWLSKAKSLRVLQLGSWEGSSNNHIEVASTEFLKSFVNLKSMRYLGLNMVSGIHELPPSVSSLGDLRILDLKACHNLTKIPADISKLTSLTHLDMSGCYFMESMPKELGHLNELLVLKGLVVGDPEKVDACKIVDLTKLKKLRKLSVFYCTMGADAGEATKADAGEATEADAREAKELEGLSKFNALRSLTIAWIEVSRPSSEPSKGKCHRCNCFPRLVSWFHEIGAKEKEIGRANSDPAQLGPIKPGKVKSSDQQLTGTPSRDDKSFLPIQLEKLDLRCYPNSSLPNWINPGSLEKLEKLYIRGGHLCCLKEFKTVKTLRLRHLTTLEMDWKELTSLFPGLQFLEKVRCPKLSLFPCNGYGEWKRNTEQ